MEDVNESKGQEQTEINIGNDPVMLTAIDVVSKLMIQNKISLKARGNSIPNAVAVANIITEKMLVGSTKIQKINLDTVAEAGIGSMTSTVEIIINKNPNEDSLEDVLSSKVRIEKLVSKDVKMRTFIADDDSRNELVSNVYDTTHGIVIPKKDTVVIIDDSIVRGTTLEKSILTLLSGLNAKKIIFVSSSPQIRYPDCYGIDMSKMNQFVAFRGLIRLIKERKMNHIIKETYNKCKLSLNEDSPKNFIKELYEMFSYDEISNSITEIVKPKSLKSEFKVIYQTIDNLNRACPNDLGDWYFTGNYPTPGGNKVANRSFMNYVDGISKRPY